MTRTQTFRPSFPSPADPAANRGFEAFMRQLKTALRERLEREWPNFRSALFEIGDGFIDRTRTDLARWTGLLAVGALSPEDFEWLVFGRRELAELEALRLAGLSLAQVDRFRAALVETVVGTAFRHFL